MRKVVKLVPDQRIGLIIGWDYHTGVIGKLGVAAISSDTILDAIKILFQFTELLMTYFHFDLRVKDRLVSLRMDELLDLKDLRRFVCEREFASIYRIACDTIGASFRFVELRIAYPKPPYAAYYSEIFQCPVVFNADHHEIVFDHQYLFKQLPMANPLTRTIYEKECKQLSQRIRNQETITKRIQQEISFHDGGLPKFERLAHYMNMSPRTLNRRLAAEGTSYRDLVSSIRNQKATHLLQTTDLSIDKIAKEIGYSDLSNFYRAFKRWTGHNPGIYRKDKFRQDNRPQDDG